MQAGGSFIVMGKPKSVPMGLPCTLPPPEGLGLGRGREGESVLPEAFSPSPEAIWRVRSSDVAVLLNTQFAKYSVSVSVVHMSFQLLCFFAIFLPILSA